MTARKVRRGSERRRLAHQCSTLHPRHTARIDCRVSAELNQTLYYLIGNSIIRLVVIDYLSPQTVERIGSMRPLPSYYAVYAKTKQMEELFKTVRPGAPTPRSPSPPRNLPASFLLGRAADGACRRGVACAPP